MWPRLEDKTTKFAFILVLFMAIAIAFFLFVGSVQVPIALSFPLLGCIVFLFMQKKKGVSQKFRLTHRGSKIINVIFALLFSIALVTLLISDSIFRPVSFFICLALMFGLISVEIALQEQSSSKGTQVASVLAKIVIAALLLRWSFFAGVYQYGNDVILFMNLSEQITSDGAIPLGRGLYRATPAFPLFCTVSKLITGISDIYFTRFIIAFIQGVAAIFVYVMTKRFTEDTKSSLYAALLFTFFGLNLRISAATEPISLAVPIIILALFAFISAYKTVSSRAPYILIFIVLLLLVLELHFYYSLVLTMWMAILIPSIWVYRLYQRRSVMKGGSLPERVATFGPLLLLVIVGWLAKTVYTTKALILTVTKLIGMSLNPSGMMSVVPIKLYTTASPAGAFLSVNISYFIIILLATVGLLLLLKNMNKLVFLLVALFIGFVLVTGMERLLIGGRQPAADIAFRNLYFLAPLLVIFGGYALSNFVRKAGKKLLFSVIPILMVALSFFSVTNEQANFLDPLFYSGDVPSPLFNSNGERMILEPMISFLPADSTLVTDKRTATVIRSVVPKTVFEADSFSKPSLPELDEGYQYVLLSTYSLEKGMIFRRQKGGAFGHRIDETRLLQDISNRNKIWESQLLELYKQR